MRNTRKQPAIDAGHWGYFSTPGGQLCLDEITKQAEFPSINEREPIDPYALAYKEGKRALVRFIKNQITANEIREDMK